MLFFLDLMTRPTDVAMSTILMGQSWILANVWSLLSCLNIRKALL